MTDRNARQHFDAKLAIHASEGAILPKGPKPSVDELAQLLDDTLDFTRRQEVYSHLNCDTALYQQWIGLVATKDALARHAETSSSSPLWLKIWSWLTGQHQPFVALGGLAACGLVVAALIVFQPSALLPNTDNPSPRYASKESIIVEQGIIFGVVQASNDLNDEQRQKLPFDLPGRAAESQHPQAVAFGYQLIEQWQLCQQNPLHSPAQGFLAMAKALEVEIEPKDHCRQVEQYLASLFTKSALR